MIKVLKSGSNTTVIENDHYIVLVSYKTPVAFEAKNTGKCFQTSAKYSVTTTKHINKFLDGRDSVEVCQGVVDDVLESEGD